jgi:Holliday junction resolvasome RuvABC DNA-binding subunit
MRDYFRQVTGTFTAGAPAGLPDDPVSEARRALQALGYKPAEVHALLDASGGGAHTTEDLIRAALQRAAARP